MDDDSVDSETESRLVISTIDITNKDVAMTTQPVVSGANSRTCNSPEYFPCNSSLHRSPQSHEETTTDERQISACSSMENQLSPSMDQQTYHLPYEEDNNIPSAEMFSLSPREGALINQSVSGYQQEDGELEEGELEDDDETSDVRQLQEQISETSLVESPVKERSKEREGGKKRSRDKDDDKRRKRHRHHKDDESSSKSRKKLLKEEKEQDFDALLKQELYLRGEASTPEIFQKGKEGESGESGSGEEWDKTGRNRHRKKHSSRSKSKSPSRKNEAICMFFLQGNCQKGNSCPYSHEMAPTRKLELCKFYIGDRCAKREKCLYMHKDFPCKYYHFGMKCVAGEDCKFSHSSLQEPAKNILCKHIESAPKDILGDFPRLAKNIAMSVLTLTLDKRKGLEISNESLQSVLEVEGRGFKYVDRTLKEYRKLNGIEKIYKPEDKEKAIKDYEETSPKKTSKSKHKDDSKEHDRKSGRERGKTRDKNRDDKDRHRNRGRDRRERLERHQNRSEASRGHKTSYPLGGTQRQRDFFQRIDNINQPSHEQDMSRRQDPDQREAAFDQPTKWYSSDEENDLTTDNRQGYFSPRDRMKSGGNNLTEPQHPLKISQAPDLKNIDFNYIQQLLNKVKIPNSGPSESYDNSYGRDVECKGKQEDFSSELREVFEPSSGQMNLKQDLQNLIKSVREKSTAPVEHNMRDDYSSRFSCDPRKVYQDSRQLSHDPRQLSQSPRQNSSDPRQMSRHLSQDHRTISQETRIPSMFNEPHINANIPPLMGDSGFNRGNSSSWQPEQHPSLTGGDYGREQESFGDIFDDTTTTDLDMRSTQSLPNVNRQLSERKDSIDVPTVSMYDIDLKQLDNITTAEINDINSLILKMPDHTPAKEINGSINSNPPLYYQLIEVTVQKPDFSKLRNIQADSRYFEDPRLRLMFRRNSNEDQTSCSPKDITRKGSNEYVFTPDGLGSDRTGGDIKESRDPRKQPSRDPRAEGKLMKAAVEPRVDPRMALRGDPSAYHSRDLMMESNDMEDHSNPCMTGPMFINGHLDNAMPNFNNMGPMPSPYPHMDPRGRPGLLGPAPSHPIMQGPMRPGPMHRPPYLLATPQITPINFGDREDNMMMGPAGGMPTGQMWEAGTSYKEHRANRESRHTY